LRPVTFVSGFNSFYAAILNYPHVNLANAASHLQLEISGIPKKGKPLGAMSAFLVPGLLLAM